MRVTVRRTLVVDGPHRTSGEKPFVIKVRSLKTNGVVDIARGATEEEAWTELRNKEYDLDSLTDD